jgi:predicted PurR-regulated permease PerM
MPLWVLLLYLGIQAVESYLLLPMLLRESIELPPVMVLLAVMILGSFFGILGIFVAAPLMASVMVLVKMLYIEDTLGDNKKEDTSGESSSAQQDDTQSGAAQKQPPSDGKQAQRASQSK